MAGLADLTGRTALVTGAGGGIGRGIALVLARQGADVAVADVNGEAAAAVAREVEAAGRRALAVPMDVTSRASVEQGVEAVLARWERLDVLVNNAGVMAAPGWEGAPQEREEDWDLAYQVNVRGVAYCCRAVQPHMVARRAGRIVNIASIAGRRGRPPMPHYSASKAAVINFTQALALELAPHGINVNAVCPGLLWTDMWRRIAERFRRQDPSLAGLEPREVFLRSVAERVPLGQEQTPEDIGKAVAFLASDDARCITGQAVHVDGGAIML